MALLAIFNSRIPEWFFNLISAKNHISSYQVSNIPFPRIDFTTPADERERLVKDAIRLYESGDDAGLLSRVQEVLVANQTDVVHDVLAHLAQQMIDLNKTKQAETRRFLGWLESKARIAPAKDGKAGIDALNGKTTITGYLGDYQKGDDETAFEAVYGVLLKNKGRMGVTPGAAKGEIEREYEASLNALRPIKAQLARTDRLIDAVVCRLYGLTEAEIALVEGASP